MSKKALKRIPLSKLMDLKIDFAFKKLFGTEKNKDITIVFLNAILKRTGRDTIKEVTFKNVEIVGEHRNDKQSRLDILVTTQDNHQINVEIQFTNKFDMVNRSIYYWSCLYSHQSERGMGYTELKPTIAINILNFTLLPETDLFHTTYHLYEDDEKFRIDDVMEFHFIEIPKLLNHWKENRLDPWNDVLARWLLLLGIVDQRKKKVYEDVYKELEEIAMKDDRLQDAFNSWNEISVEPDGLQAYRARLKQVMDEEAMVREAQLREEALKKDAHLREEAALEKGREQGVEKTARNLLVMDMDVETVAKGTGLSIDEVKALKERI